MQVLAAKVSVCAGRIRVAATEIDGIAKPTDLRIVANAASWQRCRIRRGRQCGCEHGRRARRSEMRCRSCGGQDGGGGGGLAVADSHHDGHAHRGSHIATHGRQILIHFTWGQQRRRSTRGREIGAWVNNPWRCATSRLHDRLRDHRHTQHTHKHTVYVALHRVFTCHTVRPDCVAVFKSQSN